MAAIGAWPRAPLETINRTKVSIGVGPFVPDGDFVIGQVFDVGIPFKKPKEFVDDGTQVQFLGGEGGKAVGKIETHLVTENADGTGASTVFFLNTVVEDVI